MATARPQISEDLFSISNADWEYIIDNYIKNDVDRTIAKMYYLDGIPQAEIGAELGYARSTIRAISTATGNSWDDTYEHLSNIARINGTMMDDKDFICNYLDDRYKRIYSIPRYVGEVSGTYPDNILLITMNGHITCSKYGVIYDSFDCRDRLAEYCWIVK